MSSNGDDVFTRLSEVIEDWSVQIARSHEELSTQIGVARSHLDRLLLPASGMPPDGAEDTAEVRARLEEEVARLHEALVSARAAADDARAKADGDARQKIAGLQAELDRVRQERGEHVIECDALREQLDAARAEIETLKTQATPAPGDEGATWGEDERAAMETEITRLTEALEAAENAARAGEEDAIGDNEQDNEAATLKSALESLHMEHADALDQIRELKERLDTHRAGPDGIDAFDARGHKKRMGEILVEMGELTEVQLKSVLKEQAADPQRRLGSLVVEHGYTSEDLVARVVAAQLRLPYEDLRDIEPEAEAVRKVSAHVVRLHRCMPIQEDNGVLTVAMINPLDLIAIEDLELASNCRVAPVVSTRERIETLIAAHYPEAG